MRLGFLRRTTGNTNQKESYTLAGDKQVSKILFYPYTGKHLLYRQAQPPDDSNFWTWLSTNNYASS